MAGADKGARRGEKRCRNFFGTRECLVRRLWFGPVPEDVASLLALAEIRILCKKMSISSLKEKKGSVMITFSKVSVVNVERLLRIIRENPGRIKLDPKRPNVLILQTGSIGLKEKSQYIREKLGALLEGN